MLIRYQELPSYFSRETDNQYLAAVNQINANREANTQPFIDEYLDPAKRWEKNEFYNSYKTLNKALYETNESKVAEHINKMSYSDFLRTKYWSAVANQCKKRANYRCQLCNKKENLRAHHRNYNCHGNEAKQIHELICLCSDCHTKFHNK